MPALQDVENVAQGRALDRGDDADSRGEGRDGLLAFSGKESFGFELGLELLERELERPGAFGFDIFSGYLQLASIFVNGDASAYDYLKAVGGTEAQQAGRGAEHQDRKSTRLNSSHIP